jgi:hypothetical protein
MLNYDMHVERLDGSLVHVAEYLNIRSPSQMDTYAATLAKTETSPQVYISVWKHNKGEVRKKFYSDACWELETFALEMFEKMCKEHDWYYEYSDDHTVWKKGRAAYDVLVRKYATMHKRYPAATQAIWETYNPFLKSQKE